MPKSEAKKRADLKHQKSACKQFNVTLHKVNDADVLEFLSKIENKRQFLIKLIRQEIKKEQE